MSDFPDLLPKNSTALERALAGPTGRLSAVPVPIRDLPKWDQCPAGLLSWLAWAHSVDLWDASWPEARKRTFIRDSFELHRIKGTLEAIRRYIRFVDARLVRAIVPPDKFYPDARMTAAEKRAYLARFQQLRIYNFRSVGQRTFGAFTRGAYGLSRTFLGGLREGQPSPTLFPYETDARARIGRQSYLYEPQDGSETKLTHIVREIVVNERVAYRIEALHVASTDPLALFAGGKPRKQVFAYNSGAIKRTFTVRLDEAYTESNDLLSLRAIEGSTDYVSVRPERVRAAGQKTIGQLFPADKSKWSREDGCFVLHEAEQNVTRKTFLPPSTAHLRVYSRLYVHDPQRVPPTRRARSFCGYVRLGMPPFNAELRVDASEKLSKFQFGRYVTGYVFATPKTKWKQSLKAARLSKSARDTILSTASLHRPIKVGDRIQLGQYKVGEWIRDTL